jgi:hypothetical protein
MWGIAELSDKYQTMTRAYDRGAQDGHKNFPPANELYLTPTETEIVQLAQDDLNKYSAQQKAKIDEMWEAVRSIKAELSSGSLFNIDTFRTRCELSILEVERELIRLSENFFAKQRDYRFFKTAHRLDRDADLPGSVFDAFSLLVFFIALDGAINAAFFMDASPYGLVGGLITAAVISLLNVGVGFFLGVLPLRYLQHRNRLHRIWAFPLFCGGVLAVILLNFGVGHYRDLISVSKDAQIPEIWQPMVNQTFQLQTLQSYGLTIVGMFIAAFSATKGYSIFDKYPEFGKMYKLRETAKDDFEKKIAEIKNRVNLIANGYLAELKASYSKANKNIQEAIAKIDEAITRNENYDAIFSGVEEACNSAIREYRKANRQVRDNDRSPPPVYFSKPITLHSQPHDYGDLEKVRDNLVAANTKLQKDFEEVIQQLPAIERQFLSESALNGRLDKIREMALRNHEESVGTEYNNEALSEA